MSMSVIAMFAIAAAGLTLAVGASLGVKWSQVQILSARPANMQVERLLVVTPVSSSGVGPRRWGR